MSNWKSRCSVNGDVVFFNYLVSNYDSNCEEIYVWDLDKTYLDSSWASIKEIIKLALERAFQKKNIPGTSSLIQALRTSWVEKYGSSHFPVYFITASPPQMELRIKEKLELDTINPFGIFFKDNLKNIHPKRLLQLTNQVGYKIQALLQLRRRFDDNVRQVLWGDDSESDAIIYNLYSDICARRLNEKELRYILRSFHVSNQQLSTILKLQHEISDKDPVEKIYINLATDTDPEYYIKFGRRTVPIYDSFQMALDLLQDGRLSENQVMRVAQDLVMNYGFTHEELSVSFDQMIRRQIIGRPCVDRILPVLKQNLFIFEQFEPSVRPLNVTSQIGDRVFELEGMYEPWVPLRIDYLHDYR